MMALKSITLKSLLTEPATPLATYTLGGDGVVAVQVLDDRGGNLAQSVMETGVREWDPDFNKHEQVFPKDGLRFLEALLHLTGMSYYDWDVERT